MVSLGRRLQSLEEDSRRRAVNELEEFFASLSNREVAALISGSQRREQGLQIREEESHVEELVREANAEEILARATVGEARRVKEVLTDTGIFERTGIRPHLEELREEQ